MPVVDHGLLRKINLCFGFDDEERRFTRFGACLESLLGFISASHSQFGDRRSPAAHEGIERGLATVSEVLTLGFSFGEKLPVSCSVHQKGPNKES
jgi:hypothetical protein